jgi:2-oxoglutarate dehydrogenase E1 component
MCNRGPGDRMQLDYFHLDNAEFLARLHEQYQSDPQSVDPHWQSFFAGFEAGQASLPSAAAAVALPTVSEGPPEASSSSVASPPTELAEGTSDLVHSYRELGHFVAQLDPLGHHRPDHPLLALSQFGLSDADRQRQVGGGGFLGPTNGTLENLVEQLRATYCRSLGVEFMGIDNKEQREWLQERMEPTLNEPAFSADEARRILSQLIAAETFEHFLQTKFLGQKRFSIEGGESLLPLLDTLIEHASELGAEEVVLGMAHRGRLNVLAHIVEKPYEIILSEFAGTSSQQTAVAEGDVKYHRGYSHDRITATGKQIHVSLSSNPSHLELVDPVIEGIVRAKQERRGKRGHRVVVPLLIHGEAAFTGQGIVPETLSLSELPAYRTGGTIHVIINNQVGFTATAEQTRFTPYPTDVARMIQAPIFHVNGDDPEAVVHAARLAIAFRQKFHVDVFIDLWCYRRHGHNETDDPTFTQPLMYGEIAVRPPVTTLYAERLQAERQIEPGEPKQMAAQVRQRLDAALEIARDLHPRQRIVTLGGLWRGMTRAGSDWSAQTAVPLDVLQRISAATSQLPGDFTPHRKLQRWLAAREEMAGGKKSVDWGCAEQWAIGSLLLEGTPVRLTGQDSERGTFSHRHAVLHDVEHGTRWVPLQQLAYGQASFTVLNTMLSELAVLGFEYGFASADPHTLVMWEAQFGDFVNGAQAIIDQFLVSGEAKWQRMNGLVLLLPHGYEGQGPEHSSARLERFLQLCGENNLQVCYPTHPAQYFHVLRRQVRRSFRKPLVLMMPKSLLRDERSTSRLEDFSQGGFRLVIDDPAAPPPEDVRRLLFCSGRVYFTLQAAREQRSAGDVAIVRIEQLYPFPKPELQAILARYPHVRDVRWVQEEPRNMGAWSFVVPRLRELLGGAIPTYCGRDEAASTATGSFRMHEIEESAFIDRAFATESVRLAAASRDGESQKPSERAKRDGSPVSS